MSSNGKYTVVRQDWDESEAGWGVRPDGYSLHLSEEDRKAYIKEYWDRMPKDHVPHEYSRPSGDSYLVDIDEKTYLKLKDRKNGLRV